MNKQLLSLCALLALPALFTARLLLPDGHEGVWGFLFVVVVLAIGLFVGSDEM